MWRTIFKRTANNPLTGTAQYGVFKCYKMGENTDKRYKAGSYINIYMDSLYDQMIMSKIERVIFSVNMPEQLPALRKYCDLAKKRMRIKSISNPHIDRMYNDTRARVTYERDRRRALLLE